MRTFKVTVETISSEEFILDAASIDAAESLAEQMVSDGERGEVLSVEVTSTVGELLSEDQQEDVNDEYDPGDYPMD
jgi:hypothetical protein